MNVLGLQLGAKPQTDEEYIQSVRAWMRYPRKSAAIHAGVVALLFAALLVWEPLGHEIASRIAADEDIYWSAFAASMVVGMRMGLILFLCLFCIADAVRKPNSKNYRTERLTLRLCDDLRNRGGGPPPDTALSTQSDGIGSRRILGMRLLPVRQTDEQYMESIRRQIKRSKGFRIFNIGMTFLLLAVLVSTYLLWRGVFDIWAWGPPELMTGRQGAIPGVVLGIAWGVLTGLPFCFFAKALFSLGEVVNGSRTERLMLRYYDELNGREGSGGLAPGAGQ